MKHCASEQFHSAFKGLVSVGIVERFLFLNKGDIFPRDKKNCGKNRFKRAHL